MMRSVRQKEIGGPEVLVIEEVPIPTPGPNQVVVKVMAIGINPVETYIRSGKTGRIPTLPYTPGQDAAGVVHLVGENVTGWKVGDRVYTITSISGTYAQFTLCSANSIHILPDIVDFDQGAGIHVPYYTAYHAIHHIAKVQPGEIIFIHGCSGATGTAALQFAKASGFTVIGSAGTPEGIKQIKDQGADLAVNHREAGYLNQIMEFTQGQGVEVIIEMLANINLGNDLPLLRKGGRVAVIGSRGPVQIDARELMSRRASIHGVMMGLATETEQEEIANAITNGLNSQALKPIVYLALPFDKVSESHDQVINPVAGALGKIVVHPWD